jgi:hypothetical protein
VLKFAYSLILFGAVLLAASVAVFIIKAGDVSFKLLLDTGKLSNFGSFIAGTVGVFWSLASVFLLFESLKQQRESTSKNIRQIKIQQFENTFFQLITTHYEILKSINVPMIDSDIGGVLKDEEGKVVCGIGVDFFEKFLRNIKSKFENRHNHSDEPAVVTTALTGMSGEHFFIYNAVLGHYYGNLRSILQYLKDFKNSMSGADDQMILEQVDNYSEILSNQLSNYEIIALSYNALSAKGTSFFNLIEEFRILRNLPAISEAEINRESKWAPIIVKPQTLMSNFSF